MPASGLDAFDRTVYKTNRWLARCVQEIGDIDRGDALRSLRAYLHALRDRVTPDVAADFAAQLPLLVRGLFYENYTPSHTPAKYGREGFLRRIAEEANLAMDEAARHADAITRVLHAELPDGIFADLARSLPEELRSLLAAPSASAPDLTGQHA
ncbi:DUF2267 domain-containing protein [Carbonactinospora thermoautotrophica]|uniref:DUF2267 domain-containing protein n=1 Tax=Carbonactinospora thermoautotrophica TaxID=1469144 RepID=UPI0022708356|nr:DUF2267 domain-containing protein [Carbonactinospora thermoautotrophica]MCX9191734.1 DUF2267 domain-containing protein [Carbonactinospora thermoautotrophica]